MKKRKLKRFFKETWGWFAFAIWLLLAPITITFLAEDFPIQVTLSLVAISILYTVAGIVLLSKLANKGKKHRTKNKEKDC